MDVEWQDVSESSLSERDTNVLQVFEEEGLTSFTFDGLKRRLGLHSETLSRVLCRLEDKEFVEKGWMVTRLRQRSGNFLGFPQSQENLVCPYSRHFYPLMFRFIKLFQILGANSLVFFVG